MSTYDPPHMVPLQDHSINNQPCTFIGDPMSTQTLITNFSPTFLFRKCDSFDTKHDSFDTPLWHTVNHIILICVEKNLVS